MGMRPDDDRIAYSLLCTSSPTTLESRAEKEGFERRMLAFMKDYFDDFFDYVDAPRRRHAKNSYQNVLF